MVTVSLTGGFKEDVATVFGVLRTAFPTDRPADDIPHEQPGDRPPVWSADFDPTEERIRPAPPRWRDRSAPRCRAATSPWTDSSRP